MDFRQLTAFAVLGGVGGCAGAQALRRIRRPAAVARAPCVVAAGVLCCAVWFRWRSGVVPGWWLPVPLTLIVIGVPLIAADLRYLRLPLVLSRSLVVGVVGALSAAALGGPGMPIIAEALTWGTVFFAVHAVARRHRPGSIGAGDLPVSAAVGAAAGALGWQAIVVLAVLAAALTVLLAMAVRIGGRREGQGQGGRGRGEDRAVPYGPGLLVAGWLLTVFPGSGFAAVGAPLTTR